MKRQDELRAMVAEAAPGPWPMETVRTPCGTCHRIGPFPRPEYASKSEGWACVYDDYPPGIGSPDLLANARLIAQAPTLATELAAALDEVERLRAEINRLCAHKWASGEIRSRKTYTEFCLLFGRDEYDLNPRYDAAWPVEGKG